MTHLQSFRRVNWSTLTAANAQTRPEVDALRCDGEVLTWRQFDARVSRLASWLRAQGVLPGDRIAVLTMNRNEFLEAVTAATRVGGIAVPINFRLTPSEVGFILSDCSPAVVVVESSLVRLVAESGYTDGQSVVIDPSEVGTNTGHDTDYEEALASGSDDLVLTDVDEHDPAMILYTSGTTGRPKGAVLTHLNLFVQGLTNVRSYQLIGEDEVVMVATPLFHIGGLGGYIPVVNNGLTAVIHPSGAFDASEVVEVLEREQVTSVFFVPAQWQAIVDVPAIAERKLALRTAGWGAAPATPTLLARMADVFPGAVNVATFGQTEMSPMTCVLRGEEAKRKLGSVGRPINFVQTRIVDAQMNDVPVGEVGEIVYRGPTVMPGYWNRPDANAEVFEGEWFHSGDLVRQDEDGYIYVVDRLKDMIISGGENIYCAEVENALAAHPAVAEVAVIGREDAHWGQVPVAVVVAHAGKRLPELAELRDWLGERLASYKHPKDIVVVQDLPRNASGKVQKFALREQYAHN